MTITLTAFERSPDGGKGLARDTRVRWALEEVAPLVYARIALSAMHALTNSSAVSGHEWKPICRNISLCCSESM